MIGDGKRNGGGSTSSHDSANALRSKRKRDLKCSEACTKMMEVHRTEHGNGRGFRHQLTCPYKLALDAGRKK